MVSPSLMTTAIKTMTIMTMPNITNLARQLDGVPLIDDDRFRRRHKLWIPPHYRLLDNMGNCYSLDSIWWGVTALKLKSLCLLENPQGLFWQIYDWLYYDFSFVSRNRPNAILKEFHLHMCVNVDVVLVAGVVRVVVVVVVLRIVVVVVWIVDRWRSWNKQDCSFVVSIFRSSQPRRGLSVICFRTFRKFCVEI